MAGGFLVNGRKMYRAGVYSLTEGDELAGKSPAAVGNIGILMELSKGGQPLVPHVMSNPGVVKRYLPAREAEFVSKLAFAPSTDPKVPNGAQAVTIVRVNPATQATKTFANADGGALKLLAADYGLEGSDILATLANGTNYGRKFTVSKGTTEEEIDDVAFNNDILLIEYDGDETGITSMKAAVDPAVGVDITYAIVKAKGTYTPSMMAFDGTITFTIVAQGGGAARTFIISGVNKATGVADTETVTITDPATTGTSTKTWSSVTSIVLQSTLTGNCTISGTAFTLAVGTYDTVTKVVDRINLFSAQGFRASKVVGTAFNIEDMDKLAATDVRSKATTPGNQAAYNPDSQNFGIDGYVQFTIGVQAADKTFAITGTNRLTDAADTESVVIATGDTTATSTKQWSDISKIVIPVLAPDNVTIETNGNQFKANLYDLIQEIEAEISLVTSSRVTGATGLPINASGLLTGGTDGAASMTDWENGYKALRKIDCSHVVPISTNPAVHDKQTTHLKYMSGEGRGERAGYVGVPAQTGKAALKALVIDINYRNQALYAQQIKIYDEVGVETTLDPPWQALLAAAMDAGRKPEWSLIWTVPNILEFVDNPNGGDPWDSDDDRDDLIKYGVHVLFDDLGIIKWERDVTTHLTDDHPVYTSIFADRSLNLHTRNLRIALEASIGKGTNTEAALIEKAKSELDRQIRNKEIKNYDPKTITFSNEGNGWDAHVDVACLEPTVFIRMTTHVTRLPGA